MFRDLYPITEVYCDYKIIKTIVQLNGKEPVTYKKNNFPEKQLRDTKKYRVLSIKLKNLNYTPENPI